MLMQSQNRVLKEMKTAGKAIVGMKILGQGALRTRQGKAIKFARR
jgi:hypothetical protein